MKLNLNIVLILIIGVLATIILFKCNPDKPELVIPDDSAHKAEIRKRDSLYALRGDTIVKIYKKMDSVILAQKRNREHANTAKNEIKNFTPDSRRRWLDSTLESNGFNRVLAH